MKFSSSRRNSNTTCFLRSKSLLKREELQKRKALLGNTVLRQQHKPFYPGKPNTVMELNLRIQRAIAKMGFEKLLSIQEKAIPVIMQGKNLLAQSKTGTGKTAAFAIPILQKLNEKEKLQALVLEPTRELAIQVGNDFRKIGAEMPFRVVVAYGGTPDNRQKELLDKGANVIVGTPDRVLDLIASGHAKLEQVKFVVLDEADLLLEYALALKTRKILKSVPEKAQKLFFCVHLPSHLEEDVGKYMGEFEKIKTFSFGDKLSEKQIQDSHDSRRLRPNEAEFGDFRIQGRESEHSHCDGRRRAGTAHSGIGFGSELRIAAELRLLLAQDRAHCEAQRFRARGNVRFEGRRKTLG